MFILLYANCVVMYCVSFYVVVGNQLYLILSYLMIRVWVRVMIWDRVRVTVRVIVAVMVRVSK